MSMNKTAGLLFILLIVTLTDSHAQLISYSKDGTRIKYGKETTQITIQPEAFRGNVRSSVTPLSLPTILPGIIGAGFSIAKTIIAQQQKSIQPPILPPKQALACYSLRIPQTAYRPLLISKRSKLNGSWIETKPQYG
jgi:hypothetical protein